MSDLHSKEVRSYNMRQIKAKDTKPEMIVRKFLFSEGFRYRLHDKKLPGKPDVVLKKYKIAININGCFWHGHENCRYFVIPKTRTEWWKDKIETNKSRDRVNMTKLKKLEWTVITIFECQLKENKEKVLSNLVKRILK